MPRAALPPLLLCTGKDCRDSRGYASLHEVAGHVPGAVGLPCQGVCDGPVVGVLVRGEVRWFAEVRGGKARRQLVDAVAGGDVPKGWKRLEVRSRRGLIDHPKKAEPLLPTTHP